MVPPKSSSVPDSTSFAFAFEAFPVLPLDFDVVVVLAAAGFCVGCSNDTRDDDGGGCFFPVSLLRFGAVSSSSSISSMSSNSVVSTVSGSDSGSASFLATAPAPRVGALRVLGIAVGCVATLRFGGIVRDTRAEEGSVGGLLARMTRLYRVHRGLDGYLRGGYNRHRQRVQ